MKTNTEVKITTPYGEEDIGFSSPKEIINFLQKADSQINITENEIAILVYYCGFEIGKSKGTLLKRETYDWEPITFKELLTQAKYENKIRSYEVSDCYDAFERDNENDNAEDFNEDINDEYINYKEQCYVCYQDSEIINQLFETYSDKKLKI